MSKIINDGLTWSGIVCFIAVPIIATVGVKGLIGTIALHIIYDKHDRTHKLDESVHVYAVLSDCSKAAEG